MITPRAAALVLAVSVLLAGLVYGVSKALSPTYQSSAIFRVTVPNQQGVNDPVVTAANDLATQYAQLADSTPVINAAAARLHISSSTLRDSIDGSTVNAQNLVQVTASAPTKAQARARAAATVTALLNYLDGIDAAQSNVYARNVSQRLTPINQGLNQLVNQLNHDPPNRRGADAAVVASLEVQRQQVLASLAQDVAAGQPTLQAISTGSSPSQVSPKPVLDAAIAFIVALLLSARVAYTFAGRTARARV